MIELIPSTQSFPLSHKALGTASFKGKYIVANSEYEKLKILYEQCNASTADFEKT